MKRITRRRLLRGLGAGTAAGLAGCLDGLASGSSDTTAQATFFVFGDIAAAVAGDATETDLLVPVGQHGHGWEPGPRVREDIYDAQLLLHGMDGFQPWVDDIRSDLADDEADVTTVDVSDGVGLLEAGAGHDHTHGHDEDGHSDEHHDDEHDGGGTHDEEQDSHDHTDEGNADPHFWMDPVRVKRAVTNVRQGLAGVDEENADAYAENADDYAQRLDDLHEQFRDLRESASKDVLLVAGHDAFQYFGDRYDVRIEALTDVSPDDQPTTRDIEQAQAIIEEHDLEYICADPLESQEAARRLVEDTDAKEVLPLTAMPGLKEEWEENGWGYVEVMENVNPPTLAEALDAQ